MKTAFAGAVVGLVALVGANVVAPGGILWYAAAAWTVAFGAVYLAHIARFAVRSSTMLLRKDGVPDPSRRQALGWLAKGAAAGVFISLPIVGTVRSAPESFRSLLLANNTTCNCYVSSDCSSGQSCGGYGDCKLSGKLDGTCRGGSVCSGILQGSDRTAVADAIDLHLAAYRDPIVRGGGWGNEAMIQQARLRLPNPAAQAEVQEAAHDALDVSLGFDFQSIKTCNDLPLGNVRSTPDPVASLALLDAVRASFRAGILDQAQSPATGPIQGFFAAYPDYHPMHTGRIYPHGHPGLETGPAALATELNLAVARINICLI